MNKSVSELHADLHRAVHRLSRRRLWVAVALIFSGLGAVGAHRAYLHREGSAVAILAIYVGCSWLMLKHGLYAPLVIAMGLFSIASLVDFFHLKQWVDPTRRPLQAQVREDIRSGDSSTPQWVVTLVHGTWARGEEWHRAGSDFQRWLSDAFGGSTLVTGVEWSGSNSHSSRIEAALRVREHLVELQERYATSNHVVIGHSHGGNVALYAAREKSISDRLVGVVTMGTPFILCRPRDITASFRWLQWSVPALITVGFIVACGWVLERWAANYGIDLFADEEDMRFVPLTSIWMAAVLPVWFIARRLLIPGIWRRVLLRQAETLERLDAAKNLEAPVLVMRAQRDEALWGMLAQYGIGAIPFAIWRRGVMLAIWLVLVSATFIMLPYDSEWATAGFFELLIAALVIGTVGAASLHLIWLLLMAFAPLARAHGLAFGGETISDNWFVDIRVSPHPPEHCIKAEEAVRTMPIKGSLRHSAFYRQRSEAQKIAQWALRVADRETLELPPPFAS